MKLFKCCCGGKSVKVSELKNGESATSVSAVSETKSEESTQKAGTKKRTASRWRKWAGRLCPWKKAKKKDKPFDKIQNTDEIKPVAENITTTSTTAKPSTAEIKTGTNTSNQSTAEQTLKDISGTAPEKNITRKTISESTESDYKTLKDISGTAADENISSKKLSESIESDYKTCSSNNSSTSSSLNPSASSNNKSTSSNNSRRKSTSNSENKEDVNENHIHWKAEQNEKLCEDNVNNVINNRDMTPYFLMAEEGEGEITLGDEIGQGGFAIVRKGEWKVHRNDGQVMTKNVAIKIINNKDLEVNEIKAVTRCKHSNIIELYFVVIFAERTFLGFEMASRGDLTSYIEDEGPLLESPASKLFGQIVDAVHYCHLNGVAHMDIKSRNILMYDNTTAKLSDFGLSLVQPNPSEITGEQFKTDRCCGTLMYMAPEIFTRDMYDSRECDVWSLGILLYRMLTDKYPFPSKNIKAMKQIPKKDRSGGKYLPHAKRLYKVPTFPPGLSASVRGLILRMLIIEVNDRANISEVQHHSWLTNNDQFRFY